MKITTAKITQALRHAILTSDTDLQAFKQCLTVTHEFDSSHQAIVSDFTVIYKCPILGIQFWHRDTMLWIGIDDILINGDKALELDEFDQFKEFTNNDCMYLNESGEWVVPKDDTVKALLLDLALVYKKKISIADHIPDWKEIIVEKVKSTNTLDD